MTARVAAFALALTLGGCGMFGPPRGASGPMNEMIQQALSDRGRLKAFDHDQDGKVTTAELDKGLSAMFAKWDGDNSGAWNGAETKAANDALIAADPAMPPARDWDQSGGVTFDEFAAWNRGRFRRADTNEDGAVDPDEFAALPKMPRRPPGGMPPGGIPPGGKPQGGKPPSGGGMPGGR